MRPATQILARRTVRPLAAGRKPHAVQRSVCGSGPRKRSVALSVGLSTALDAAALLSALDRYPFGCSEQIASRALPLLYVNDLASAAHLALDTALDQRIRDAIDRLLARQGSNGSFGLWSAGGDDAWLDSYVSDFLTRARERGFAVPDTGFKLALDRLRNFRRQCPGAARRTAGAISPMRSMCWRATARRRSATCATTPTPSSMRSPRRSPRRRSPRRSAMLGDRAVPSAFMRRRCLDRAAARARLRPHAITARCCAMQRPWSRSLPRAAPRARPSPARSSASRRRVALRPTPPRRRTPGWCLPPARWPRTRRPCTSRSMSAARRRKARSIATCVRAI